MSSGNELGVALRAWRERVRPEAAGLPADRGRRIPGLRREEVALLGGISVDYLVRLEQGRARNPSVQVLAALARVLRLSAAEIDLFYRLAGASAPPAGSIPAAIPRAVRLMVDRMSDTPLAVFTAAWDTVETNALWRSLIGETADPDTRARNLIWRHFAAPDATSRVERTADERDAFERELVADLRRASERYPDDRAVSELTEALLAASPRFAELWGRFEATTNAPGRKTIVHPELGPLTVDCDVLTLDGSDLRIVMYSAPPGTRENDLLRRLAEVPV